MSCVSNRCVFAVAPDRPEQNNWMRRSITSSAFSHSLASVGSGTVDTPDFVTPFDLDDYWESEDALLRCAQYDVTQYLPRP